MNGDAGALVLDQKSGPARYEVMQPGDQFRKMRRRSCADDLAARAIPQLGAVLSCRRQAQRCEQTVEDGDLTATNKCDRAAENAMQRAERSEERRVGEE